MNIEEIKNIFENMEKCTDAQFLLLEINGKKNKTYFAHEIRFDKDETKIKK